MDKKRPVDIKRESGGQTDMGSEADGAIVEMFEYNGILLTIKERSIYELALADNIDPKRENPNLPTTIHRLILNRGTESEMVCRTFLTARRLFKESSLLPTINSTKALSLALESLKELVALEDEITDYLSSEKKLTIEYEERSENKTSYSIPSVTDVNTRCKTIFQKADHVTQTLMEIITIFHSNSGLTKQSHFPRFHELIKKQYGDEDDFVKFIGDSVEFLELVRALRNCLDHRLNEVQVKDFELQIDSDVLSPTIEIDYRGSIMERTALSHFLPIVVENLITVFELTTVFLVSKNTRKDLGLPKKVMLIPEERRRNKFIRYGFWMPIGQGGFFDQ